MPAVAATAPLLSYIVLSYNYEDYIGTTLRSILDQTVQDFEIVVVDDASRDRSCAVIESFNDPRIRLLRNERNLGGAGSYNRAVEAARGTWLVNLDADDWVLPAKAERQLDLITRDPAADVVGTHIAVFDAAGAPHPDAASVEAHVNAPRDLNLVENWIGRNELCRSSTMVRRAAHLRIGLDDAAMVRAPDYELWTRALRLGCRFAILPERLTCYRLQARGVTFGDPLGTLLEIAWAAIRNLIPAIEQRGLWPSFEAQCRWIARHEQLAALGARERERLLAMLVAGAGDADDFPAFRAALARPDPRLEALGRRVLVLAQQEHGTTLRSALKRVEDARDYWKQQSDAWEAAHKATEDARDYWKQQSDAWEAVATGPTRARKGEP